MSIAWINPEPTTPSGYNALNYTEQGGDVTHIGGTLIIEEGAEVEGLPLPFDRAEYQGESSATTVAALKEDFNALLQKLQQAGLMEGPPPTLA